MAIFELFLKGFISEFFKRSTDYFKEHFGKNAESTRKACQSTLEVHFGEVVNWCSRLEFIWLEAPKTIDVSTIPITISNRLRKFGNHSAKDILEEDILLNYENYLILGDPGSGKTTTLKRIVQKFLFKTSDSVQEFPVLIRLKEIGEIGLLVRMSENLGLNVEERTIGMAKRYYVGSQLIDNALPAFLNTINALVILDGYDEINTDLKDDIKQEINTLSKKSSNYKILLTSRHGEDFHGIEGFTYCELKELSRSQIIQISEKWCAESEKFLSILFDRTYNEISNRPLFLNFLILHFNTLGYLPSTSHEATKQIIHLLLDEWNKFQGVKRLSRYSNFYPKRKFDFLSHLAFEISFGRNMKRFSHNDLVAIYNSIYEKFGLKQEEANEVAQEIESHTGIIIKLHNVYYEFSHLVLQEYLAAEFIVNQPFSSKIFEFFKVSPATIALATCISTDSAAYFSNIFLNTRFSDWYSEISEQTTIYLKRILTENMFFNISVEFGVAITFLYYKHKSKRSIIELLDRIMENENVKTSVSAAVRWYHYERPDIESEIYVLKNVKEFRSDHYIKTPEFIAIPKSIKSHLDEAGVILNKERNSGNKDVK